MAAPSEWLATNADETFLYLTTTGRKTGNPHRIEIWFGVDRNRVFLMAGGGRKSDWVRNIAANPNVSAEIAGEIYEGLARIVEPDSPDDELAREILVTKYGKDRDLADWRQRSLPIVIEFP